MWKTWECWVGKVSSSLEEQERTYGNIFNNVKLVLPCCSDDWYRSYVGSSFGASGASFCVIIMLTTRGISVEGKFVLFFKIWSGCCRAVSVHPPHDTWQRCYNSKSSSLSYWCTEQCVNDSAGSLLHSDCTSVRWHRPYTDIDPMCCCKSCRKIQSDGSRKLFKWKREAK